MEEVDTRKVSELRDIVQNQNESRQEAEKEGELSIDYVYGCPDCWRLVSQFDSHHTEWEPESGRQKLDTPRCPNCNNTNLIGNYKG